MIPFGSRFICLIVVPLIVFTPCASKATCTDFAALSRSRHRFDVPGIVLYGVMSLGWAVDSFGVRSPSRIKKRGDTNEESAGLQTGVLTN